MLFYFILGGLAVGLQLFVRSRLAKIGKAKLFPNCLMVLAANASFILGLAWMFASIAEHEIQAAMMGLVIFGGTGVIIGIIAYRVISHQK